MAPTCPLKRSCPLALLSQQEVGTAAGVIHTLSKMHSLLLALIYREYRKRMMRCMPAERKGPEWAMVEGLREGWVACIWEMQGRQKQTHRPGTGWPRREHGKQTLGSKER